VDRDAELPSPKWHRNRLSVSMTDQENDCVMQSMRRAAEIEEADREDHGLIPFPPMSEEAMKAMPDNELVHAVWGFGHESRPFPPSVITGSEAEQCSSPHAYCYGG
jgi:hypothetical protein